MIASQLYALMVCRRGMGDLTQLVVTLKQRGALWANDKL
jgi:hypothetical protein